MTQIVNQMRGWYRSRRYDHTDSHENNMEHYILLYTIPRQKPCVLCESFVSLVEKSFEHTVHKDFHKRHKEKYQCLGLLWYNYSVKIRFSEDKYWLHLCFSPQFDS